MTTRTGGRRFEAGLAAGLAFAVVQLLARLVAGIPSAVEIIQDQIVLLLPGPLFSFVLDRLLYLGKPLFFGGLLVGAVVILGAIGVAAIRSREPLVVAAALWLVTGLLELVLSGKGPFEGRADVALSTFVSFAAYAAVLTFFNRTGNATEEGRIQVTDARAESGFLSRLSDRRELVAGSVLAVATVVLARLVVGTIPTIPTRAAAGAPPTGPGAPGATASTPDTAITTLPPHVTATADFYVVSKNLVDPRVDASSWSLTIAGMVDRPMTLTQEQFQSLPSSQVERTLECISNEVGGDLMSNGLWKGVALGEILSRAGAQSGAGVVHFTCVDGYTESMPLQKALDPATLLVYELNGAPLPAKHGFPVRVLGAGTYGMKNPKWVNRIEVAGSVEPGFWERQGWNPDAIVQTTARIDSPTDGARLAAGAVSLTGVAFAGDRGISKVEVSPDAGASWLAASLLPPLSPTTWAFWQASWQPKQPGTYTVAVRAVDGTDKPQMAASADTFPAGATGYHQIRVVISA